MKYPISGSLLYQSVQSILTENGKLASGKITKEAQPPVSIRAPKWHAICYIIHHVS
jgi:hypothetical protein